MLNKKIAVNEFLYLCQTQIYKKYDGIYFPQFSTIKDPMLFANAHDAINYCRTQNYLLHKQGDFRVSNISAGVNFDSVKKRYLWYKAIQLNDTSDIDYTDFKNRIKDIPEFNFQMLENWCIENGKAIAPFIDSVYWFSTVPLADPFYQEKL